MSILILVGGWTNPFEKISIIIGSFPHNFRGENKTCLYQTTSQDMKKTTLSFSKNPSTPNNSNNQRLTFKCPVHGWLAATGATVELRDGWSTCHGTARISTVDGSRNPAITRQFQVGFKKNIQPVDTVTCYSQFGWYGGTTVISWYGTVDMMVCRYLRRVENTSNCRWLALGVLNHQQYLPFSNHKNHWNVLNQIV